MNNCKIAGLAVAASKEVADGVKKGAGNEVDVIIKPEKKRIRIQIEDNGERIKTGRYNVSVVRTAKQKDAFLLISPEEKGACSLGFSNQKKQNLSLYLGHEDWEKFGLDKEGEAKKLVGRIIKHEGKEALCVQV